MSTHLGKLVFDDSNGKLVYDDSTGKLVCSDKEMFTTQLSPQGGAWYKEGVSGTSEADAVSIMQAAEWQRVSVYPSSASSTYLWQMGSYICRMNAARHLTVLPPELSDFTIKSYGLEVTGFAGSGAKLTMAESLYGAWAEIVAAPSVAITGTGWIEIPAASWLGSWMILYQENYALNDQVTLSGARVIVTIE